MKSWLAPGLAALALLAALVVMFAPRPPAPEPLLGREVEELNDRMEGLRERSHRDAEPSSQEQAAELAYELFRQFKKGGFRQFLSSDPERALRCQASLGSVDPEAGRILDQAMALVQPALSPDLRMAQGQLAALPPDAFAPSDKAFDAHLGLFARCLLEFCRTHNLPPSPSTK